LRSSFNKLKVYPQTDHTFLAFTPYLLLLRALITLNVAINATNPAGMLMYQAGVPDGDGASGLRGVSTTL
jgi:hypothetical protein